MDLATKVERVVPPQLSFEQKLALHQLWMARLDAKRRELLALMGTTSALLVAIPLVASHVTVGSPTAMYFLGTAVFLLCLFGAAIIAGSDFGEVAKRYEADRSIDDDRIARSEQTWRRQILSLALGMLVLFGLCLFALAAVSDDLKPAIARASRR